jgi:hypothetical protein
VRAYVAWVPLVRVGDEGLHGVIGMGLALPGRLRMHVLHRALPCIALHFAWLEVKQFNQLVHVVKLIVTIVLLLRHILLACKFSRVARGWFCGLLQRLPIHRGPARNSTT